MFQLAVLPIFRTEERSAVFFFSCGKNFFRAEKNVLVKIKVLCERNFVPWKTLSMSFGWLTFRIA